MNDTNLQNREIAWRMYFENRDQTNWKMFDVTARLLTGTTGITTLTQAFSLDERKATKRMYVNAINHNSERKCPSCSDKKKQCISITFMQKIRNLPRETWLICAECNIKLGPRTSSQREQLKINFPNSIGILTIICRRTLIIPFQVVIF